MLTTYNQAVEHAEATGTAPERIGDYYFQVAEICEFVSQFEKAEYYFSRALGIANDLGPDHASAAAIKTRLGCLLIRQGKSSEAEAVLRAALDVKEKTLGPIHVSLSVTLLGLGQAYEAQGDWDRAIRCYERAFEIERFLHGEVNPNTASCAAHLAVVLIHKGQTDRAEEFCKRVLMITEQLPRADNPITWQAMDILAEILRQKTRYTEAEALFRRILVRRRERLGLDNPSTAMTLGRLGLVRVLQGDTVGGSAMCRQALDICRQTVGPAHLFTIEIQKVVAALPKGTSASG